MVTRVSDLIDLIVGLKHHEHNTLLYTNPTMTQKHQFLVPSFNTLAFHHHPPRPSLTNAGGRPGRPITPCGVWPAPYTRPRCLISLSQALYPFPIGPLSSSSISSAFLLLSLFQNWTNTWPAFWAARPPVRQRGELLHEREYPLSCTLE